VAFLSTIHVAFHDDDILHLYQIANEDTLTWLLHVHAGHLYVTRNAVFLLFAQLFGPHAASYMWSAYLTHLLNVGLLFVVARRLSGSTGAACAAAALWGSSPINAGALTWYSVYGQVLGVTLMLWLVWRLLEVADGRPCSRSAPLRWSLLLWATAACFGTGFAMGLAMPAVVWLLLPPSPTRRRLVITFAVAMLILVPIYVALEQVYAQRGGTPALSNFAIAWIGLWQQRFLFVYHLLGVGIPSLLLGGLFLPAEYPGAIASACMAVFAAALLAALGLASQILRRRMLAALLLALAAYGMIAVGRSFFADVVGLGTVVRPTRYHYSAPVGLALALAVILRVLGDGVVWRRAAVGALSAVWVAAIGLANVVAAPPIDLYARAQHRVDVTLAEIGARIAAAPPGQPVYIPNRRFYPYAMPGVELRFPGLAALYAIYFPDDVVDGRRIFFVESDPKVFAATRTGRRSATLVVAPEAVPGAAAP